MDSYTRSDSHRHAAGNAKCTGYDLCLPNANSAHCDADTDGNTNRDQHSHGNTNRDSDRYKYA
jgi:hypothetical protein